MSFSSRLAIIMALTAMLPAFLANWWAYEFGRQQVVTMAGEHLSNISVLKTREIEARLDGQASLLFALAQRPLVRQLAVQIMASPRTEIAARDDLYVNHFGVVIDTEGSLTELSLLDPGTGQIIFSSNGDLEGKFREDRQFFLQGKERLYVGEVEFDLTTQQPKLYIAAPVYHQTRLVAVLVGTTDWSEISRAATAIASTLPLDTYVTNAFGAYLTDPPGLPEMALRRFNRSPGSKACARNLGKLNEYTGLRGQPVLGASAWSDRYRFCVIAEEPLSVAYREVEVLARKMGLFSVVMVILVGLAGGIIGNRFARPLRLLAVAAQRIGTGDLSYRTGMQGRDECGQLARSFDQMSDNLQRSNQDLENFAYVASHDLQEPLRMVANFTALLQKRYAGQLDDKADEYIHFAVDGAQRMQRLINDLLQYSRLNTQAQAPVQVDLNVVIEQILIDLKLTIEARGAQITVEPLPTLSAEPIQMRQLFQNLISNALKFHSERATEIHISAQPTGTEWLFAVSDNGIGIDPTQRERIFLIFQRLHPNHRYPGTGLGLAMVKRIVERHGGSIRVESQPGEGSRFLFTLANLKQESSRS